MKDYQIRFDIDFQTGYFINSLSNIDDYMYNWDINKIYTIFNHFNSFIEFNKIIQILFLTASFKRNNLKIINQINQEYDLILRECYTNKAIYLKIIEYNKQSIYSHNLFSNYDNFFMFDELILKYSENNSRYNTLYLNKYRIDLFEISFVIKNFKDQIKKFKIQFYTVTKIIYDDENEIKIVKKSLFNPNMCINNKIKRQYKKDFFKNIPSLNYLWLLN